MKLLFKIKYFEYGIRKEVYIDLRSCGVWNYFNIEYGSVWIGEHSIPNKKRFK